MFQWFIVPFFLCFQSSDLGSNIIKPDTKYFLCHLLCCLKNIFAYMFAMHLIRCLIFISILWCCQQIRALGLATITAGDPFVKQANLILGIIVLLSTAPNGDTAPPTPRGQALTPTPSPSHCHPSSLKRCFVTVFHFGSLTWYLLLSAPGWQRVQFPLAR